MTDQPRPAQPTPTPVRQARLRPEHAGEYPGMDPAVWYPAVFVAEYVRARGVAAGHERPLDPNHFEFRGGERRPAEWDGARDDRES